MNLRSKSCLVCAALAVALCCNSVVWAQDVLPDIPRGDIAIRLKPVVTGMGAPDYATSAPDNPDRLYVVEQKGLLQIFENGSLSADAALDIQSLIGTTLNPASANDERGFLGVAFHPGFSTPASPGLPDALHLFEPAAGDRAAPTYPVIPGGTQNYKNVINEWKLSAADPNVVDPASRREIISFGKQANNHNGGTIAFGPDGYLYLAMGDGGNANDVGAEPHRAGRQRAEPGERAGQNAADRSARAGTDPCKSRRRKRERTVPHSGGQSVRRRGASTGNLCLWFPQSLSLCVRRSSGRNRRPDHGRRRPRHGRGNQSSYDRRQLWLGDERRNVSVRSQYRNGGHQTVRDRRRA